MLTLEDSLGLSFFNKNQVMDNNFMKYFPWFGGQGPRFRPFFIFRHLGDHSFSMYILNEWPLTKVYLLTRHNLKTINIIYQK